MLALLVEVRILGGKRNYSLSLGISMYTVVVTNLKVNRVVYLDTFDKKSDAEYDFNYWISDPMGGIEMNNTPGRFEILGAVLLDDQGVPYISVSLAEGTPSDWIR